MRKRVAKGKIAAYFTVNVKCQISHMLEYLAYLRLLWYNYSIDYLCNNMPSKNACSADNQQERLKRIGWIVGYVDGEGCFSVSLFRNKTTTFGWQVFPEFVVTQGEKSKDSLAILMDFFQCGKIYVNKRKDNHKENLYRYCVRSKKELTEIIIPFFKEHNLQTAKKGDFDYFSKIISMMNDNVHGEIKGIRKIAKIIEKMNHKKSSIFLESSETRR